MQGIYGNRGPVTVSQCAIACTAAAGCEAFTYNQVQNQCFLKAQQCPKNNKYVDVVFYAPPLFFFSPEISPEFTITRGFK